MKNELFTGLSAGLLAMAVLAGCAPTTPNLDSKFGDAMNQAKAQQIINPDAPKNTDPVAGIDGQAAKEIISRYHKAYEAPSPAPSGAIGSVSGSGTTLK
jgi:hypothetical protein